MSFLMPKVKKPKPPPSTPSNADASVQFAGERAGEGYSTLISTGPMGLTKPARGSRRTLIGGS